MDTGISTIDSIETSYSQDMLEYQLLSIKGYDDDVIGLMMLVDDVEEIKVDDEEGLLKDRIEKTIYSLNLFSSWLEELRL